MGLFDALKAMLWARRRSPEQARYFLSPALERFQPDELAVRELVTGVGARDR
jgi:hypothetical protein